MVADNYYFFLLCLISLSFGVGLFHSTTRARYFAYIGVVSYILGLFIGVYYYGY